MNQARQTPVTVHFYHCDHLGTPIALTNRRGQIDWATQYDPWGNITQEFNPLGLEQNIRLPGQYHDRETGLYYNYHRYYDPKIGSYINQDPIGLAGGLNKYGYVFNDPMNRIDSTGLWSEEAHNYFIEQYFGVMLPPEAIAALKAGSAAVDSQFMSDNYAHAMGSKGESISETKRKACGFFNKNFHDYQYNLAIGRTTDAYFSLGMALHTVMDSTSPVHAWKVMDWFSDGIYHGDLPTSKENLAVAMQPYYRFTTLAAIQKAVTGSPDFCGCQ
jgi:RHS repeat-associated protein